MKVSEEYDEISRKIEINNNSITGLSWKISPSKRVIKGTDCGTLSGVGNSKYFRTMVTVNGTRKSFRNHRIVWLLTFRYWPIFTIDHLDGNGLNNNISNLRDVTMTINNRNIKKRKDNSSGKTGVSTVNNGKYCYVYAFYCYNNKTFSKTFSVNKFGIMEAYKQGCIFRNTGMSKLEGYTNRHGK